MVAAENLPSQAALNSSVLADLASPRKAAIFWAVYLQVSSVGKSETYSVAEPLCLS